MELVNGVLGNRYMHSLRVYRLHKRTHIKKDKAQSTQEHTGVHTHTHMTQKRAQRAPTHIMKSEHRTHSRHPEHTSAYAKHTQSTQEHTPASTEQTRAQRNTHRAERTPHANNVSTKRRKDTDSGCLFCCEQRMAPLRAVARDLLYLSPHAACMPRCSVACPLYADVTLHIR